MGTRCAPRGPRYRSSAAPLYLTSFGRGSRSPCFLVAVKVIHNQGRGSVQDQEQRWFLLVNQERQARSWDLPPSRARSVRYRGARTNDSEARGGARTNDSEARGGAPRAPKRIPRCKTHTPSHATARAAKHTRPLMQRPSLHNTHANRPPSPVKKGAAMLSRPSKHQADGITSRPLFLLGSHLRTGDETWRMEPPREFS